MNRPGDADKPCAAPPIFPFPNHGTLAEVDDNDAIAQAIATKTFRRCWDHRSQRFLLLPA